jgi:hypothetical protein
MSFQLRSVHTGFEGFERILALGAGFESSQDTPHEIDMSSVKWLDANMCAPLGALFHRQLQLGKAIRLRGYSGKPREIALKNGFLQQFGQNVLRDSNNTTIQYREFQRRDREAFETYITTHFRPGSRGLPKMSDRLLRKFRVSLFELYGNAIEHSESELGVFACGQFFPRAHRLDFSIADLGVGMREKVRRHLGREIGADEAIAWAMEGNTTRTGGRPGGLGLRLIREFIKLNGGRIVVVSSDGYWECTRDEFQSKLFERPFPGTVVTIEINTADKTSYCLQSEISPDDVFK